MTIEPTILGLVKAPEKAGLSSGRTDLKPVCSRILFITLADEVLPTCFSYLHWVFGPD